MKKKLHYTVVVEVDDSGACLPGDIGEGIQAGIDKMISEGLFTRDADETTLIERVTTCFSHSEDEHGSITPEIHRTLFASTANITAETNELMLSGQSIGLPYDDVDYGYLVRVPDPGEDDEADAALRLDIGALVEAARSQRCKYLRLDRDADPIEGLPTYEW